MNVSANLLAFFNIYLIGGKKVGEKCLNFLQVTKFFPEEIFPRLSFSRQYFSLISFHLTKNLSWFFFQLLLLLLLFLIYLQNLLLACFFWCTLFIVVEQTSFNKNFEMRVKVKLKLKVKWVGEKWQIWKISLGKVTNFSEVTKFFPDENFPPVFFPDKVLDLLNILNE